MRRKVKNHQRRYCHGQEKIISEEISNELIEQMRRRGKNYKRRNRHGQEKIITVGISNELIEEMRRRGKNHQRRNRHGQKKDKQEQSVYHQGNLKLILVKQNLFESFLIFICENNRQSKNAHIFKATTKKNQHSA